MTLGDRWDIYSLLRTVSSEQRERMSKTIKKEANHFSEATFILERQDLWAKLDFMENFGIAVRGLLAFHYLSFCEYRRMN